jgi:hypothetical protein
MILCIVITGWACSAAFAQGYRPPRNAGLPELRHAARPSNDLATYWVGFLFLNAPVPQYLAGFPPVIAMWLFLGAPPDPKVFTPMAITPGAGAREPDPASGEIGQAVDDALQGRTPGPVPAPETPSLTRAQQDRLRLAVLPCWNAGVLDSEALMTTVVVAVSMHRDGKPEPGSLRLVGFSGGSDAAARRAFEAARRAILRCGANGYDLPIEAYERWREIEMTFNPESMRIE